MQVSFAFLIIEMTSQAYEMESVVCCVTNNRLLLELASSLLASQAVVRC